MHFYLVDSLEVYITVKLFKEKAEDGVQYSQLQ